MIRRPLRPLARILSARARGQDPNLVEAEERAARLSAMQREERQRAETRLLLLGLVFVLGFTTVGGRMALLSASVPTEPRAGVSSEPILAQRAEIVDRHGAVLATNIVTASLYAHPHEMIDPRGAADGLAAIFPDLDAEALHARFTDGRRFLWVKRTVSPEQRQRVHDLGEPGLLFGPREARLYPNGPLAAHVLGGASFGREGVHAAEVIGTAGVERVFDDRLRDPASTDRAAPPLHRPRRPDRARGGAGRGHGADARQGRLRHPDGGRHRPDPRPGEPARLRPQPPPAAADERRPRRQPALQPRRPGPLRARLDDEDLPRRARPRHRPRIAPDHGRHLGPDALGPLHHPRLPQLRAAPQRRGRGGQVLQHRHRPHRHRAGRAAQQDFLRRLGFFDPVPVELVEAGRTTRSCRRAGRTSRR
jgi:cell division protein FtsI (penicillin-binding protein 3)